MPTCPACGLESPEGFRFCGGCGAELAPATSGREARKTVTVVFCDVTGSTELGETVDPERLRALLARYFERMKTIVERHGGTVEKFIGDAVMAVFGVPAAHEDDALRAVRAAAEMRDALPELGLAARIGVMTGEVVTGTEERLATGDAVNVAARLEQAAPPGTVLLGQPTLELVRSAVDVEPVEPLQLKGKREPVPAHRLLHVHDIPMRQHASRFVGRDRELALVVDAMARTRSERRCELLTIVGEAGVGKSRLVAEALGSTDASVVRCRCLPYGEGITYWPVVEALKQLDVLPPDEAAAAAIRSLLGEAETESSSEQLAWAFRKTLEHAAADRSLVVVFDDIQWGEKTFLDLIEHVALLSTGAPLLLLCMARPELTEGNPAWPVALRLEPLADEAVAELIEERAPESMRETIARAAGGNPLFVEEMLAMAREDDGEVVVPPTLQALLAARLDQLETAERGVLERGAIEGEVFHRGAVLALSPAEAHVTPQLASLVRKNLIRPDNALFAGEDGFRFRHLLIRDAAYDGLPKSERAELHERFAGWLEQHGAALVERDELLAYHLEQAWTYRVELGLPREAELAAAARRRLTTAGHRAAARHDYVAAASLLERAAALVPAGELDAPIEIALDEALGWSGRSAEAIRRADTLSARASAAGDDVGERRASIRAATLQLDIEHTGSADDLASLVEESLPLFEAAGDDYALYVAHDARAVLADHQGHLDAGLGILEQALFHAGRAGHVPSWGMGSLAAGRFFGGTPASDVLAWLDANDTSGGRDHILRAYRAGSLAMLGRFGEARAILAETRGALAERGAGTLFANITAFESVWVELWAGDAAAAAAFAAEGCRLHEESGDRGGLALAAAENARALYELDQLEEADAWAGRAAELGGSVNAQMVWRQVRAKLLARGGDLAEAEQFALEAIARGADTDALDRQGDAYADLAEVLILAGRRDDAAAALSRALERYERKENLASARRVRSQAYELREGSARREPRALS